MKHAAVGLVQHRRLTVIATFGDGRVEFDLGQEGHVQLFAE